MVLAVLYDVHGNLPALEAVLDDAASAGADRYLLGGDYTLFGGWPAETIERLESLDADWIRGNGERWTADPEAAPEAVRPAIAICRELLGEEAVTRLAALAATLERDGTLYCHGSPVSDVRSFLPEPHPDDEELLTAGGGFDRLVFGHTHLQFTRMAGDVELVNPGSVGMPLDGDVRAAYGLVRAADRLELRRVEYDAAAAAAAVRQRLGEAGELPARRIEQARFDVD